MRDRGLGGVGGERNQFCVTGSHVMMPVCRKQIVSGTVQGSLRLSRTGSILDYRFASLMLSVNILMIDFMFMTARLLSLCNGWPGLYPRGSKD